MHEIYAFAKIGIDNTILTSMVRAYQPVLRGLLESKHPTPSLFSRQTGICSRLIIACAFISSVLLVTLHLLKPDFSLFSRYISEYEIGPYGAVMRIAFIFMGFASFFLMIGLWRFASSTVARAGLLFHLLVAVSLFGAAVFVSDPASLPPSQLSASGMRHVVFSMIGIPSGPIASLLVAYSMTNRNTVDRTKLAWPAWALTIAAVLMFFYVNLIMATGRTVGPEDYVGLANRIVVIFSEWWWMSAGFFVWRLGSTQTAKEA